jgi:putative ABC transport system substrate-binding protein
VTGFAEGQNVSIEYHSTDGHSERLAGLAADLVRRQVAVIVTMGGSAPTLAAKAATSTVPIVFIMGGDAVEAGLVTSISRPGANLTGMSSSNVTGLARKRLEFLRELLPGTHPIAVLMNVPNINTASTEEANLIAAARALALQLVVFRVVATEQAIDTAFANIVQQRIAALMVSCGLNNHRDQIIALPTRHAIPAMYSNWEYVRAGGGGDIGPAGTGSRNPHVARRGK